MDLEQLDGALFVKKMKIEMIDDETIKYGKNTFFYSDAYIRKLRNKNIPLELIDDTFSRCYQIYCEVRYKEYRKNKDSQSFLEKTVDEVESRNISNFEKDFLPNTNQKSGLIHVLANDSKRDVRWGVKECE